MMIASATSFVLVIMFTHFSLVSGSIVFISFLRRPCIVCSLSPPRSIQFLDQLACDVSDHVVSPPASPAARPRRTCSRTLADASSLPYSSCQFHHSYGGV